MSGRLGHLAIVALAWAACGVTSALVLARLTHVDEKRSLLIGATTALPVLLVPAYGALVAGLLTGQRALTLLALLVVGYHLVISAPLVTGRRGVTTHGEGAEDLRVLTLNVEYDKDTGARITDQVRRWEPDVVVLSEVSALTLTHLDLMQYPYSFVAPRPDAFGGGVWSRYPVRLKAAYIGGRQMIAGTIELPGGSLSLIQVHTDAPRGSLGIAAWKTELAKLRIEVDRASGPTVFAGDFNAARTDRPFARLLRGPNHLVDAGGGRGYLATWPSGHLLPPFLPLDHVLVSRDIGVQRIRVLPDVGSDHRGVVADLVLPAAGSSAVP